MPFIYTIYVEYYDEDLDRFWFNTLDLTTEEQQTAQQLDVQVREAVENFLVAGGYEELREYIDERDPTQIYSVEAIIRT
jgi:hypothetical protein